MLGHKSGISTSFLIVGVLAFTLCLAPGLSRAGDSQSSPAVKTAAAEPADNGSPQKQPLHKRIHEKVKAALHKINPVRMMRDREFKKASALFPAFCKDWEHKLHERELNNEQHINWQLKDGYETGTYVGYGPINHCDAHQSSQGFSIGKLQYDEMTYYLVGKTKDEAQQAKKVTDTTSTTELFRWDKGKWFY